MDNAEDFILNSDFATLKNDNNGILTISLPNFITIPSRQVFTVSDSIQIGKPGASFRSRISTSLDNKWYLTKTLGLAYITGGSVPGQSGFVGWDMYVVVRRASPTTVELTAIIGNPYNATMTIGNSIMTLTAYVATFLPPIT